MVLTRKHKRRNKKTLKQKKIKIALAFFGITRSLKYTIDSIKKNILEVFKKNNIDCTIFMHTYKLNVYKNPRTGESTDKIDNEEYLINLPTEPQDELYDQYLNNRTMACSNIAKCIYKEHSQEIYKFLLEDGFHQLSHYILSDMMVRCYHKISVNLSDIVATKSENNCDCKSEQIATLAPFDIEIYRNLQPSTINNANYTEFNRMAKAADELKNKKLKHEYESNKTAKLILFGQELGMQSGTFQLLYGLATMLAILFIFSVLLKKMSNVPNEKAE